MKKIVFLFLLVSQMAFSQDDSLPVFLLEFDAGYSVGVNLTNATHFDIKLLYPYSRFGFVLESGGLFSTSHSAYHVFIGPAVFFVNNANWRIPLIIGIDFMQSDTSYFGAGGILSVHRKLYKYLYGGFNLEAIYAFNNVYEEFDGYQTTVTRFDDGTTKTQTIPKYENKNHSENNFYFKPSFLIGLQF